MGPKGVTLSDTNQPRQSCDHAELHKQHEVVTSPSGGAVEGCAKNLPLQGHSPLGTGVTWERGPLSLAFASGRMFLLAGIRVSCSKCFLWPRLVGWEKSNLPFLLSSPLRNELAPFLPQFVGVIIACLNFSSFPRDGTESPLLPVAN